jgi:membrane protein YqaA with SNARE-associated domain
VLTWLAVSLGVAFGSALLPLVSVELYVIGLATTGKSGLPWPLLAATVALGQVAGKSLYYFAARGSLRLPALTGRGERFSLRTKRIRAWFEWLTERCRRHPGWLAGTFGVSSVLGLPPFMATTIMAGLSRMSPAVFFTAGLLGRFIRFGVLAAAPALVTGWW